MDKFIEKGLILDKSNWKITTLDNISSDVNVRVSNPSESEFERFVGLEHIKSGELKISSWGGTVGLSSSAKHFSKGDILFARRNVYLKRSSLANFEGVCSGDAFVLRENEDEIIPGFLSFILNSEKLWEYANSNAAGTMSKRVKWRDLAQYKVLLPPKDQQRKIASLIWSVDESLDKLLGVRSRLDITIQSIFKERCLLSQGGRVIPVKELLLDGPRNGFSPKGSSTGEGSQTVSIGAVKNGKFNASGNIKYAVVEDEILTKFDVKVDDVFVVRGNGNKYLCGKAGISDESYPGLFYPDLLVRLRFDRKIILPDFAAFQWNTIKTHMKLLQSAKSTNGIWKVNGDDIKRHKLFVPKIVDQRIIMDEVSSVGSRLSLCNTSVSTTDQLRSSLINEIFIGI